MVVVFSRLGQIHPRFRQIYPHFRQFHPCCHSCHWTSYPHPYKQNTHLTMIYFIHIHAVYLIWNLKSLFLWNDISIPRISILIIVLRLTSTQVYYQFSQCNRLSAVIHRLWQVSAKCHKCHAGTLLRLCCRHKSHNEMLLLCLNWVNHGWACVNDITPLMHYPCLRPRDGTAPRDDALWSWGQQLHTHIAIITSTCFMWMWLSTHAPWKI